MGEDEHNRNDSHYERFLKLQGKMLNALSPEEREQYDFHLRFLESLKEHLEKLDALPEEKRSQVEGKLRENLAVGEKEQEAFVDDNNRFSYEGLHAMRKFQNEHAKSLVEEAHKAHLDDKNLREAIEAKARQGREKDDGRER